MVTKDSCCLHDQDKILIRMGGICQNVSEFVDCYPGLVGKRVSYVGQLNNLPISLRSEINHGKGQTNLFNSLA